MSDLRVAVVTGGNKGIGFAIVKGLCKTFKGKVYLTARNEELGRNAIKELNKQGYKPEFHQLDITDIKSRQVFANYVKDTYGGFDVLVNNAGIAYKVNSTAPFVEQVDGTLEVNFFGTLYLCQLLFPLLRPHARVVNLSSSCGHLSVIPSSELQKEFGNDKLTSEELIKLVDRFKTDVKNGDHQKKGWGNSAYCISKVAVSALTFIQHRAFSSDPREDIIVNCVHPGYVDTDMSSHKGPLTPDEGAASAIKLATLPNNVKSPVGEYVWHDFSVADWKKKKPNY